MASDEDTKSNLETSFEWNVENEIRLFEAMIGHKPVGINKHFHMACISEKFESLVGRAVSSDIIWKHLESMFDLTALDKKESLPFPNEVEEFSLPEAEYSDLINEKLSSKTETSIESKDNSKEEKISAKSAKDSTPAKETAKKEKRSEAEESSLNNEADKKETVESEPEVKKGKSYKEEKPVKTRGKRSTKDKTEEEIPKSSVNKKDEEASTPATGNKKEKQSVGKRALRSRADDSLSNKSLTPPPVKRARRI